jgi:membrane fusion protein, copper/silver efflux system
MKKVLAAVVIVLLMVFSYVAGKHHTSRHETPSTSARHVLYWVDPMHPDFKSDHPGIAPDCGMPLEPVYADSGTLANASMPPMPSGTVSIDSDKQQLFGIRVATVQKTSGGESLRVLGRVLPDETRVYRVNAGSDGFVRETYNDSVGELVKKGQKLATAYVGDTLGIASGFLAATASLPGIPKGKDGYRTEGLPGAVSKQGFSSIQGYTDRLRNLGMSDEQLKQMSENRQLPETIDVMSPVDGFILSRNISPGQHFDRSMEFYQVADLSKVWIVASIFDGDVSSFRPGTIARASLSGQGRTFSARVSNVLPQVDPATRTLKLRLEADNGGYFLRPDMFVDIELPVAARAGLTVPLDALIDSGREKRVFVEGNPGVFEPRQVEVGWRSADRVQIVHGLKEGERVVSAGTFLVDSESRLQSGQSAPKDHPQQKVAPMTHSMPMPAMSKKKDMAAPEHYLAANPGGQRP